VLQRLSYWIKIVFFYRFLLRNLNSVSLARGSYKVPNSECRATSLFVSINELVCSFELNMCQYFVC